MNSRVIVGYVKAVDPDGYALTYSLVDDAGGRFAIRNGTLFVADGTKLDYATAQSHTIKLLMQDIHGGSHEEDLTIQVRNPAGGDTPRPATENTPPMIMLRRRQRSRECGGGQRIGRSGAGSGRGRAAILAGRQR